MNAKKFLIVVLLFGMLRICHAAPQQFIEQNIFLSEANGASIKVYPCLTCINAVHTNSNFTANEFQTGIGLKLIF
jgi:hypothetical protein